ncbi:xylose isomerase (plasmid) [Thermus thermophilus]|uniref:Xylose isomerase n=1 Tax=Thermus thermophilus TaxID=274 RepID=A0AAD1KW70_THETH|nr:xylose isomerase [Thermus thermophilus]BCZ90547.1 xylose isomerase [Thermus thermophilus]
MIVDAPLKRYMRPGIVHFKAYPVESGTGPIIETLVKLAEDAFFAVVEVGWMKDPKVRDEARHILEQSHLEVAYAMQPALFSQKLSLCALDPEAHRKAVNQAKNCIREACQLGARWVRLPSGKDPGPEKREAAKKILVETILELREFAKDYGDPLLTLKVFDRSVDKEALVGPAQDALDVAQAVRRHYPEFGLVVDLSHFPLLRESPEEVIPQLRDYLVHVHIGNCYIKNRCHAAYGDLQPRFGFPGSEIDVQEVRQFFRLLLDQGFLNPETRPVVSAEVRPLVLGERSELIVANAKRVFEEAWALA